ncbi:MAG TPA: tetratricopeptide repeat protein [Bacteroidota bacterium]|nr:tetratricopeptide repeat protein [Bacteroidota bacterium]
MSAARGAGVALTACLLVLGCGREKKLTVSSPDALPPYREGVSLWEKFYYPEAKRSFEEALRHDSTFAMAWCRLAMVEASSGASAAASVAMNAAVRHAGGVTERERLFIAMWHAHLDFNNDLAGATADSLIRLYPDEKEAYLFRGSLYEEVDKNIDAALGCYRKAVAADSTYAQAIMSLGYAYSTLGNQPEAVRLMQQYIRLAPDAADPRASYADLLVRAGRYDEALDQYTRALALKPDYWYAIREIGNVYSILGRLKEAEAQFHRALSLLPQGPEIEAGHLVADGSLQYKRGAYGEAKADFQKALAVDSLNYGAAEGLVRALGKLRDFEGAERVLARIGGVLRERHLTNSSAMLSWHLMRAGLLTDRGDLAAALAECDSAMGYSLPLTRAAVERQRAQTHFAGGDLEDALDDCGRALEVNPNSPQVLLTLVKIYHAHSDARMTAEIGGRLLALWSHADPDFQDRNELLRLLGKPAHGTAPS